VELAGQDVHWEPQGAFTGAIAPAMLADACCTHCIVGHSERRQLFGETDETVRKKVGALLQAGIHPIVCVGETLAEREASRTLEVVDRQVRRGLAGLPAGALAEITVAYEPVWAIGTGRTATAAQAQEVHGAIRAILRELCGGLGDGIRIQYGGSVKPENAAELMSQPDVDGALVGGASLKANDFAAIVKGALR
jgi:triosephosphate isomerase